MSRVLCPVHLMADVSQLWQWQLPGQATSLPLATPVCVRCHPRPHDGGDQVLSETGDAGAVASVTRDRRASGKYSSTATRGQAAAPGRCSCSVAASLQWQWPSPLVPSCRLQCCTTNSKQQRPGPGLLPSPGYFHISNNRT